MFFLYSTLYLLFKPQKTRITYLMIFSWIVDFVWIVYWGPFWNSNYFKNNWAQGIQKFVITLSSINFLIKVCSLI